MISNNDLDHWRRQADAFERQLKKVVVGMDDVTRMVTIAIFARGHVLLEGDVGVGKTTLLRAVARAIGGAYARVEGTIDLMPNDLIYHTWINQQGKPQVDPGPLLAEKENLSTFFFNEVNRARPQVHALLLRVMAEKSVQAFNQTYHFPHLQVFADRNRVERDETYSLPPAARDRFMFELHVGVPSDDEQRRKLIFSQQFHDTDKLVEQITNPALPFSQLNDIAQNIQLNVTANDALQDYALRLWQATYQPAQSGICIEDVDVSQLLLSGASPRGMSMMLKAARVVAWLDGRDYLLPEDIREVFAPCIAHRLFLNPVYELRREAIIPVLIEQILQRTRY